MSIDQGLLLVGVNGFVIAALVVAYVYLVPTKVTNASAEEDSALPTLVEVGSLMGVLRDLAMKLSPSSANHKMQRRLDVAGNPKGWSVERVFAFKGMALIFMALLGYLLGVRFSGVYVSSLSIVAAPALGLLGFYLPDWLLASVGQSRQDKMQKDLPDTLDLMSVCMKAGLGFDQAVARVAANGTGPMAAEFARVFQEFRIGNSRLSVLQSLAERTTVTDLQYVVQALIQADKVGMPIADVLAEQGKEMRTKRRQRAEEKAQKVAVKILFPMLVFILPAIGIVMAGPAVIQIMEAFA